MTQWRMVERGGVRDTLGEGAMWSEREQAFYWVDILAPALNRLSLADGSIARWPMPEPLGWVAARTDGGLIGGFQSGFARLTLDPLAITPIHDPEPHLPGNRMNDGKADRHGAIWCGTMDMAEQAARGTLYRLSPDGRCEIMDSGYRVPNGPAFSLCGNWLYHADTALRTIYRYALTGEGLGDRAPFIRFDETEGYPDGMTVDAEDMLWVAHWDGGRISRFDPDGRRVASIALPTPRITSIGFAGAARDRMFVTSAATGLAPSRWAGALYEVDAGVRGMPCHAYAG